MKRLPRGELRRTPEQVREAFLKLRYSFSPIGDVARLLEVDEQLLRRSLYVERDRARYDTFVVKKRSGGDRVIHSPPPRLRFLQAQLNAVLNAVWTPKPAVHGFVPERSILTNAGRHVGRQWLLNLDLRDFFPSIHVGRVIGSFRASPFDLPTRVATVLAQICTTNRGVLAQGAPSSPAISNIVCARMDGDLMRLAKRYRLNYSRYCDDMTFSTPRAALPPAVASYAGGWLGEAVTVGEEISSTIEANGFEINLKKTTLQGAHARQEVTGIVVNQFLNVKRSYVRGIRATLHVWRRFGLDAASDVHALARGMSTRSRAEKDAHFRSSVRGRIEHVGHVRGRDDVVYQLLRRKLAALDPGAPATAPATAAFVVRGRQRGSTGWNALFNRWARSVQLLEVTLRDGTIRQGTAFAFDSSHLATAAHNLAGVVTAHPLAPTTPLTDAMLHAAGADTVDCALLEVNHGLMSMHYMESIPAVGEEVALIGFATMSGRQPILGLYAGVVESTPSNYRGSIRFIHPSIAASGGLSGSPLIDRMGRVRGILVESTFEQTARGVPRREFCTVLPIGFLLEAAASGSRASVPLPTASRGRRPRGRGPARKK